MQHKLLIGADFLNDVEIVIKENNISINKPSRGNLVNNDRLDIFQIEYTREVNKVDVSHATGEYNRELEAITETYVLKKERDVGVNIMIVLKEEEPIYQNRRWLSPAEREEVNTQISV
ncbi:hypothetical protein KM043_017614 [Ampulex compressa]|nr:hypothetical protein KM043_017614 [Ampulex compressa]